MKLIASNQLTLTNVNDGQSSYTHIAYAFNIIDGMETIPGTALTGSNNDTTNVTYPNPAPFGGSETVSETVKELIQVTAGRVLYLLKISSNTEYFRYNWYDSNMTFLSRAYTNATETKVVVPSNATYLWISIPSNANASILSDTSFSMQGTGNDTHVGMYVDNFSTDSNDITKYKWTLIKGSDGAQGIPGNPGADGKTQYTHIAYADNAMGGGFSQTDQTKAYIGMYVDFTATDSTDVTKYKWTKWRGDKGETGAQGIQGPKGSDGRTPYLHIAYANSADGKTDFTTSNTDNKRYLGTYTDYTQADSTDPTKYKWVDMVGTVDVSARNLWIQSKATGGFVEETLPDNHITGQKKCYRIPNNTELSFNIEPDFSSRLYRKVTFSAWVKYENVVQGSNNWNVFNCFKHRLYYKNSSTGATSTANYLTLEGFSGTSDWKYIKYTYDYSSIKSYDQLKTNIRFNLEWAKSGTAWITGVMVQFGNVATGHVWAPEDIQEQIDNKADQALTQDQLNALAEKNNLIKAEMEAKASVETVNQWITAYQNYVKSNDADRAKSEQALQDASARILKLNTDVGDLKQQWSFIDTYLTMQNEGLIIGKSDGSAYAKFSDDRISLFSGSSEVMYISQGVLRIENGIFTKTIQIGRFRFETHPADNDMLVLRYLGGV